jgi:sugar transferase (PEP-CTERM system associated)
MGLYRLRQRPRHWETVARVIIGVVIGAICYVMLIYVLPDLYSGRGVLAGSLVLAATLVSGGRIALLKFIDTNPVKTRIIVLGTEGNALKIGRLRRAADRRRFEIIGYTALTESDRAIAEARPELRPIIPLDRVASYPGVDEIVVALNERRGKLPTDILLQFKGRGVPVTDVIDFLERETGKIDLDLLSPSWFVYTEAGYTDGMYRAAKRLFDVLTSALVFLLTLPLFIAIILTVWIEDGFSAPILYRQKRVGLGGRPFELLKFRSMRIDAESETGPQWASVDGDGRVTRVGKLIRRFRIDELPQLFNVFRGEMSIVGPRPERPKFVELLSAEIQMFGVRHNMRPGLTGWAQLNFPYGASVTDAREKLSYDIYYIKNASLTLDLLIFLQTIEVVVWGKAISMAGSPRPRESKDADTEQNRSDLPESGATASVTQIGAAATDISADDPGAAPSPSSSAGRRN